MFDIATIQTTDRTIEITHPGTGENIGIRVTLMSIADERMAKIKRRITDKRLSLEQRNKSFKADEIEDNKNDLLVAAVVNWDWYAQDEVKDGKGKVTTEAREQPTFEGEVPKLNPKNLLAVIGALPWFGDQLREAFGETESFFTTSKAN